MDPQKDNKILIIVVKKLLSMLCLLKGCLLHMDYKKKKLDKVNCGNSYEEIDTRLATGWYVDSVGNNRKKNIKLRKFLLRYRKKFKLKIFIIANKQLFR